MGRMAVPRYKGSVPSLGGGALIAGGPLDRAIRMRYRMAYVGIQVQDMDRSIRFYTSALGMRLGRRQAVPETGGEWADLRSVGSEQVLELNWYPERSAFFKGPYRNGDELDHLAFECEDVDAAYRELLGSGRVPATRLSKRAGQPSPTSSTPTASGSSSSLPPTGPVDEDASRSSPGRSGRRRRGIRLLSEARRPD